MDNLFSIFDEGKDFKKLAIEKINREMKAFKGGTKGKQIYTYVANTLREFCEKDDKFAEVFYKTKRSFSDCVDEITRGCGSCLPDIEAYRRAAKFYFPNSEVEFVMTITIVGDEPDEKYINKEPKKKPEAKNQDSKGQKKSESKASESEKKKEAEIIQISLF